MEKTIEEIKKEREILYEKLHGVLSNIFQLENRIANKEICRDVSIRVSEIEAKLKFLDMQEMLIKARNCHHLYISKKIGRPFDTGLDATCYVCLKCGIDTRLFTHKIENIFSDHIIRPWLVQDEYFRGRKYKKIGFVDDIEEAVSLWKDIEQSNPNLNEEKRTEIFLNIINNKKEEDKVLKRKI